VAEQAGRTNEGRQILIGNLVAVIALVVLQLAIRGAGEDTIRSVVRITAQLAVLYFCAAFGASSLRVYWRSNATAWMLRYRRHLGLSFALFHLTHLAALVVLGLTFPAPFVDDLNLVTLVGGGLAYFFLVLQAVTSNDASVRKLGRRRWTLLHTVGSYYIWIIFAQSYVPRALEDPLYVPFAALVLATLAIRMARKFRTRTSSPA
jgi:DMSO/TMAO reductase YedYZ heme-binding membrane subunit